MRLLGLYRALLDVFPDLLRLEKFPVPDVERPGNGVDAQRGDIGQHIREDGAFGHREKVVVQPDVGEVHRGGVPLVHLQGMHVELLPVAEDVEQQLRRLPDGGDGIGGVVAPEERKVRDGFELEEIGAGHHEEVSQHQVAVPVGGQVGQAVEHVVRPLPGTFDHLVDLGGEGLEPDFGGEDMDVRAAVRGEEGRMAGEPEVDELSAVPESVRGERLHQDGVVPDQVDLPDDVVPRDHPFDHAVEAFKPGPWNPRFRVHASSRKHPCSAPRATPWGLQPSGRIARLPQTAVLRRTGTSI